MLCGLTIFCRIFSTFSLNDGIFHKTLSLPKNTIMHNIDDYFSRGDGPIYLHLRDDGVRVLARLDRFYSSSSSV